MPGEPDFMGADYQGGYLAMECAMKIKVTEAALTKLIMDYLWSIGGFPQQTHHKYGHWDPPVKGMSDIICCLHGKFVAIEAKGPRGKERPAQKLYRQRVKDAGGIAIVAYSLEDVEDVI